ncbi:hypothetical protein ACR3K2_23490 [Cryptosporidium serpentis]
MGQISTAAAKSALYVYSGCRSIFGGNKENIVPQRPPDLDILASGERDRISEDWRWLALKSERRLNCMKNLKSSSEQLKQRLGNTFDISQFTCFVPRTVLEAIADKRIGYTDDFDVIIESFKAAVMFCDASGFTALTTALDKQLNGAERLGDCINNFFTPLIQIIHYWGGDVIKFSGDAICVVWPVDDEGGSTLQQGMHNIVQDNGADLNNIFGEYPKVNDNISVLLERNHSKSSKIEEDLHSQNTNTGDAYSVDMFHACRLACECCLDIHRTLHNFPTPIPGRTLTLHIGVGYGRVTILQVGGVMDRWEYVVGGPPFEEIAIAEPLAKSGETVISPSVYSILEKVICADSCKENPDFKKLRSLLLSRPPPPPPLATIHIEDEDVDLLRRYIPPPVYKCLSGGYSVFLNEVRRLTCIFVSVKGLDISTYYGSKTAHQLMQLVQKAAYTMEGSVNKFLVDDKGVLLLIIFGLPPVYHLDDPLRAVFSGLRILDSIRLMGLSSSIGIGTGRVWIGTVGCAIRKEYTALGDTVNLSARLMAKASENEILCDENTYNACHHVMQFNEHPPFYPKGKDVAIKPFSPTGILVQNSQSALQQRITTSKLASVSARGSAISLTGETQVFMESNSSTLAAQEVATTNSSNGLCTLSSCTVAQVYQENFGKKNMGPESSAESTVNELIPILNSIQAWKDWRPHKKLKKFFFPKYHYKLPDLSDPNYYIIPDYIISLDKNEKIAGPFMPWEYYEPWDPNLRSTLDLGGVMVVYGKENCGIYDIVQYIQQMGQKLERKVFVCSNMPDTPYINISNVPLLPWKKLCTDIIETWRLTKSREKKGFSNVDRDNSIYGLAKELIHPSFHWNLKQLKCVLQGLVLPSELPENKAFFKVRNKRNKAKSKSMREILQNPLLFVSNKRKILSEEKEESKNDILKKLTLDNTSKQVDQTDIDKNILKLDENNHLNNDNDDEFVVDSENTEFESSENDDADGLGPIITSLVNGFSMYENSIICLHVRTGTSFYAGMDSESWKITRMIARIAMIRRKRKLEFDLRELKKWRRKHSRVCLFCKGFKRPIQHISKDTLYLYKTTKCIPPPSRSSPPLLFVLICSNSTDKITEQAEIKQWAKECNAFIEVPKLTLNETSKFIAFLLGTNSQIPFQLVEYVHRASGGVPQHILLTLMQLFIHKAIELEVADTSVESAVANISLPKNHPDTKDKLLSNSNFEKVNHNTEQTQDILEVKLHMNNTSQKISNTIAGNESEISQEANLTNITGTIFTTSFNDAANMLFSDTNMKFYDKDLIHDSVVLSPSTTSSRSNSSSSSSMDESEEWSNNSPRHIRTVRIPRFRTPGPRELLGSDGLPLATNYVSAPHSPERQRKRTENKGILSPITKSSTLDHPSKIIRVNAQLKKIPFAPEIVADCMSKLELLEPDEQMAAKIASAFNFPFTISELHAVYPHKKTVTEFLTMIKSMVLKDVLEVCDTTSFTSEFRSRRGSIGSDYMAKQTNIFEGESEKQSHVDDDDLEKEIPIFKEISDSLPITNDCNLYANDDILEPIRKSSSVIPININLIPSNESESGNVDTLPYYVEYYRFQSIAFQRVVSESLLSDERKRLARISRRTLSKRRSRLSPSVRSSSPPLPPSPTDSTANLQQDDEEKHDKKLNTKYLISNTATLLPLPEEKIS